MSQAPDFNKARLRALSIALVVVAATALGVLFWREVEVRRGVYASIVEDTSVRAAKDFDGFVGAVQVQLEAFRDWGAAGDLDVATPDNLDARFIPLLNPQPWAAELIIVGQGGVAYRLSRTDEGWVRDPDPEDLKRTEWYRVAAVDHAGGQHWTPSGEAGSAVALRASASWAAVEADLVRVISLGVSRAAVDSLIANFPVTERGLMALMADDGTASWYAPSKGPDFHPTDPNRILHPENDEERLVSASVRAWIGEGSVDRRPFRFSHSGQGWWGWRGPLATGAGTRDLLMLLPSSDLSDRFMTVTSPLTYGLLAIFGICVVALFRAALGYRGRLVRMAGAATHSDSTEDELRELIDSGESDQLEFKSTLRWNLRQNQPGKEIELSWLKTVVAFLNTDGGTLLVGVADNGTIVGTEKDGFRNDDKYLLHVNNLLQRHVGVEFIRHLRYDLRPMGQRNILVLDVLPADEPAFLRVDDDDQFYVRMGPASKKLSVRKTFEYLKELEGK
jgi:hypothetical protein